MATDQKNAISHRSRAARALAEQLRRRSAAADA
jgi:inosine/xanthosine triphosphate pyrophosphatase family protein